ncbi:MAG: heavy-metal-associated domain-containing protein [Clostridiales bacterium]|nr:heavy-metal-associated domain-containing protein [Clostridiales bacterium]
MKKELLIEGMSCGHCVMHVGNSLKELDGVEDAIVSLEDKKATVTLKEDIADAVLKDAVEDAGYEVKDIRNL